MYLSIVIPCYNESKRIIPTLMKIFDFLTATNRINQTELIVVDDGSTDDTIKKVQRYIKSNLRLNITLIQNKQNKGKGYSVKNGVFHSKGKYILFSDADLSTPIEELNKFFHWINEGYDIVIGSRSMKGSCIIVHQPFYREIMGKIFNKFVQMLVLPGFIDTQCGFKIFKQEVAEKLFSLQNIERFCFDVEILYLAKEYTYKIKQVPVKWINSLDSRVHTVRDSFKMFVDLFRIKFKR